MVVSADEVSIKKMGFRAARKETGVHPPIPASAHLRIATTTSGWRRRIVPVDSVHYPQ
jgi:hypothetical protein